MAKKDRTGNRKPREQKKQYKVPELGYYLIVTDTEATERCYFNGLHQSLPEDVKNKLVIKVVETKTRAMIDKCQELTAYEVQYRIPWIVFDRDQVQGFDDIIAEAKGGYYQVLPYNVRVIYDIFRSRGGGLWAVIKFLRNSRWSEENACRLVEKKNRGML